MYECADIKEKLKAKHSQLEINKIIKRCNAKYFLVSNFRTHDCKKQTTIMKMLFFIIKLL